MNFNNNLKLIILIGTSLAIIAYTLYSFFIYKNNTLPSRTPQESQLVTKDIGPLPSCTTSITQASELLKLTQEIPDKTIYSIFYKTGINSVSLQYDMSSQTITRIQKWPHGHQIEEIWKNNPIHRLTSAADGGSLDSTPTGESRGSYRSFYTD